MRNSGPVVTDGLHEMDLAAQDAEALVGDLSRRQFLTSAGHIDRVLVDAGSLLARYRKDTGGDYLDYQPVTSRDCLYPEDAAVTLLVNSGARRSG